jgi:hypothetical protein
VRIVVKRKLIDLQSVIRIPTFSFAREEGFLLIRQRVCLHNYRGRFFSILPDIPVGCGMVLESRCLH